MLFKKLHGVSLLALLVVSFMAMPKETGASELAGYFIAPLLVLTVVFFVLWRKSLRKPAAPKVVAKVACPVAQAAKPVPVNYDRNHLLENGWGSFLASLPSADPVLMHDIVTDFHNIDKPIAVAPFRGTDPGGRLGVAFDWLRNPDCDRATASDFIRGFVGGELYAQAIAKRDMEKLGAFAEVIDRFNAGFYQRFAIQPDMRGIECIYDTPPFDDFGHEAVAWLMAKSEAEHGFPPMSRPVGLLGYADKPDDRREGFDAKLRYDSQSGEGLQAI